MLRELMLAQASDWPFIMRTGTSPGYARSRVEEHLKRFWAISQMLDRGRADEAVLDAIRRTDNIFPECDLAWHV